MLIIIHFELQKKIQFNKKSQKNAPSIDNKNELKVFNSSGKNLIGFYKRTDDNYYRPDCMLEKLVACNHMLTVIY